MQIDDVSPAVSTFHGSLPRTDQSVSGKGLCVAISPDGARAYLGGHSGVWRSDDGGDTWWHPDWLPGVRGGPTPEQALRMTNVYDLFISPASSDVVLASTGRDRRLTSLAGIYRTENGGLGWRRVHQFTQVSGGTTKVGVAGQIFAAPDDPRTIYVAGDLAVARSTNGGLSWTESEPEPGSGGAFHVVAGPMAATGRRVYAVGRRVWYSLDGAVTWHTDPAPRGLGPVTDTRGSGARALAIHPQQDNVIYLMQDDLTLWKGVYPSAPATGPASWTQLPAPPVAGGTDSGATFLVPHLTPEGFFSLYASDRRSVHGIGRDPESSIEWSRSEDGHCHFDPHDLVLSADFHPWGPDVSLPTFGRALLINDGGINVSTDGMRTWTNATGLSTLNVANVSVNVGPAGQVAIAIGGGDNYGFSTPDSGATWKTLIYQGGDNDDQFADLRQPNRTVLFAPRSKPANGVDGEIYLCSGPGSAPPDTAVGTSQLQRIPGPPPAINADDGKPVRGWNVVSFWANYGYRPLVLTPTGAAPRPDGDLVTIRFTGVVGRDPALLLRTTALSSITVDQQWVTSATAEGPGVAAFQVGPALPDPRISIVQASGGHDAPTFYVGNQAPLPRIGTGPRGVWKLAPGDTAWRAIVPASRGTGPSAAVRFFADPYRPAVIYVLSTDGVYLSRDGGSSWHFDTSLIRMVTGAGTYPFDLGDGDVGNAQDAVLRDMTFDPVRPGFVIATGISGVFFTQNGHNWEPLLRSTAMSITPTSLFYDWLSCERSVYVGTGNRGLLRLHPLPPDWEFPKGSLQAAVGLITLLRVHDPGTGYGPPDDFTDAEVIVWLDSQPEKAFALRLRDDAHRPAAEGMLDLLRDAFNAGRPVQLDFIRTGCRIGDIVRVIEAS